MISISHKAKQFLILAIKLLIVVGGVSKTENRHRATLPIAPDRQAPFAMVDGKGFDEYS